MEAKLAFLHALSPLHAGTGQGVGVIDLPIAREKATNLPYVPGSSLKGVLRDECRAEYPNSDLCRKVFGPDTNNAELHAGSIQVTDLRLLLLPVRSLSGTFAWVTSPFILRRFKRDAANVKDADVPSTIPAADEDTACLVSAESCALSFTLNKNKQIVLEDLDLKPTPSADVDRWAKWLGKQLFPNDDTWQGTLKGRLCIVSDNVLGFLLQTATEITARIRLDDAKKTVAKGALWYEESLPAETILAGMIVATTVESHPDEVFQTVQILAGKPLQVGGNATVGRGLCKVRVP